MVGGAEAADRRGNLGDIARRMRRQLAVGGEEAAAMDREQMQRDNAVLTAELQETKEKLYRLQLDGKVEAAELEDRVESVKKENLALQGSVKELTQKGQKIEAAYKESMRREDELRRAKESFVSKC
jgi:hypothetical protein